jgi:glycosyltransferase involved in cell wall biosynthesis
VNILILSRYGRLGASSRLRMLQYLPSLGQVEVKCDVRPFFDDEMLRAKYQLGGYGFSSLVRAYGSRVIQLLRRKRFDLIWIEKEALPWLPVQVERALLQGVPYVLDFDDAWFHNYDLHRSAWVRRILGHRLDRLMAGARLVIGGNDYLLQRARDAGARWVERVPTVIDLDRYPLGPEKLLGASAPKIVWIGSPSTVRYLSGLAEPLRALAQRVPFKLRVIGAPLEMAGVEVECVPWTEASEVAAIAECDIGVMPLFDSPWERGKCGYKLIQYMACGLPVVASSVGVNGQIVQEGISGFLADTAQAWVTVLAKLLADAALRQRMGHAGRLRVEQEYCLQVTGPRLVGLLRSAAMQ